jgi:hypothetical protein
VIPASIGELQSLTTLDLRYNCMRGALPSEILQCKKLKVRNRNRQ